MVALHADGATAATAIDAEAEGGATEGDPHYDFWDEPDEMGQADEADDEDVVAWSPGINVARQARRPAEGAGGSNDPLPVRMQPGGPLAVVPQVAEGPHAYVGAALCMMANSPPSRAITRLQALMRQQP
jgi:hypothetical protein